MQSTPVKKIDQIGGQMGNQVAYQECKSKSKSDISVKEAPRKIKLMQKKKSTPPQNRKLDHYITTKPIQQLKTLEVSVRPEHLQNLTAQNQHLKIILAQIQASQRQFQQFSTRLYQKLLQENTQLKANQLHLNASTIDQTYNIAELNQRIQRTQEELKDRTINAIQRTHKLQQLKTFQSNIQLCREIDRRNKKFSCMNFCTTNCAMNQSNWRLLKETYQPTELKEYREKYQVYWGTNVQNNELVTITLFNAKTHEQKQAVRKEYELHSRLSHRNIIRCIDYVEYDEKRVCIVYERAEYDLHDIRKSADQVVLVEIFLEVAQGIKYLRSKNISNRNIRTDTVGFVKGVPKLLSFSLAVEGAQSVDLLMDMSEVSKNPDKFKHFPLDRTYTLDTMAKFDVWSLGVLMVECLCKGELDPSILRKIDSHIQTITKSKKLQSIICKALTQGPCRPWIEPILGQLRELSQLQ